MFLRNVHFLDVSKYINFNFILSQDKNKYFANLFICKELYVSFIVSVNMRPHSATEGRKTKSPMTERREEMTSATQAIVDDRRSRYKFVNKLSNNFSKETDRTTRMFDRVADSKSNGQIYTANERNNTNSHRGNSGNNKTNWINVAVSRLAPKEKITKNERTFALRITGASVPRANIEKEGRKFFSRLPVRTWKRLRTKEPGALRPESDATNGDVNREVQEAENEIAKSSDHPARTENDDVHGKDRANRNDIKRSERFGTRSLGADKSGLTSSVLKSIKRIKDLNSARGMHEQRKTKTSIKYFLNRNQ